MTVPSLSWWPPSGHHELAEHQVRELFAHLRGVTPSAMAEGERRMRAVIGPDMAIRIHHGTVKSLTDRRLGQFDVLQIIRMSSGAPREEHDARFVIGLHRGGALMVTPSLNPATLWCGSASRTVPVCPAYQRRRGAPSCGR